jgi:hypothetical protein
MSPRAGLTPPSPAGTPVGVRHAIGEFRAGRPADISGLLPGIVRRLTPELLVAENARYVRQGDAVHPLAAAPKVAPGTRVLVTAGTSDASIPVSAIKLLAVVLGGVGDHRTGLQVLEVVDHFLHVRRSHQRSRARAGRGAALTDWARPYAAIRSVKPRRYGGIRTSRMTGVGKHCAAHLCRGDRPVRFDHAVASAARAPGRAVDERVLQHPADRGGLRASRGSRTSDMDGAQLWRLLASPFPMLDAMISDGLRTSEMLYPDHGRFGADTGNPAGQPLHPADAGS